MEKEKASSDVYGPENLIRYHTALSFVDRLERGLPAAFGSSRNLHNNSP